MTQPNIPEYPGFNSQQNIDAWRLRLDIIDSYITKGLLDTQDLIKISKMPDDITRTKLLLNILSKKEEYESKA